MHAPPQAPKDDIKRFQAKYPGLSEKRATLMAMLQHLDEGIGEVVDKLKQEGLFENTLLFFLTDNGGSRAMQADNSPLRGFKGSLDEGGIRTPFIVSWPAKFSGGRTVEAPVISLDILPTSLDALDQLSPAQEFDGKSLLPLLAEKSSTHHETLYWCKGAGEWAVRRGDWKLRSVKGKTELFNIAVDPSEKRNVARKNSERAQELESAYDNWIAQMPQPTADGKKAKTRNQVTRKAGEKKKSKRKKREERTDEETVECALLPVDCKRPNT